jgi:hypothetical protein
VGEKIGGKISFCEAIGRLRGSCGILPAEEAQDIGRRELIAEMRPEDAGPDPAEVFVEIAPDRHEIADVVPAALPRACKHSAAMRPAASRSRASLAVCSLIVNHLGATSPEVAAINLPVQRNRRAAIE